MSLPALQPDDTEPWLADIDRRFFTHLLDLVLFTVTLGVGWAVWGLWTAREAQTPAKRIMGLQVWGSESLSPMPLWPYVLRRGLLGTAVFLFVFGLTGGIIGLMPTWDKRRQSIIDKVSGSIVVDLGWDAWRQSTEHELSADYEGRSARGSHLPDVDA